MNDYSTGCIFILSNESFTTKNLYFIGATTGDLQKYVDDLFDECIPIPFTIDYNVNINNVLEKLNNIHNALEIHRVDKKKNWFKIDINFIKEVISQYI